MKIAVLIYSRYRPEQLTTLLRVLEATTSGDNEVKYYVTYCPGDDKTFSVVRDIDFVTGIVRDSDNVMLGEAINDGLARIKTDFDPDYYIPMADDIIPQVQHWDNAIAQIYEKGVHCFAWHELNDSANSAYISFSKEYYQVIAPRAVPTYFPFWFIDTWQAEVYALAFGCGIPKVPQMALGGKRGKTQGLRDVDFWFMFFACTRNERITEANKLIEYFKLTPPDQVQLVGMMRERDKAQIKASPRYEELFGNNKLPPEPYYKIAYENAQNHKLVG